MTEAVDDSPGIADARERELWRAEIAERLLGLSPVDAAILAADPLVDLASARELARQGCPPATAVALATRERDGRWLRLRVGRRRAEQ